MSKIEKALNRARAERANLPVASEASGSPVPEPGTALVLDRTRRAVSAESIGRMSLSETRLLGAGDLARRGIIFHRDHGEDPTVQAFRELRTKIVQQSQGQNSVILVTAVSKGGGSSFVAQNLGAAFAFDAGKTALVIDCNLKNPSLHRLIGDAPALGLIDYLESPDIDIAKIIRPVGIARFRAIAAGKRREIPEEYFTSLKMKSLIDSVRQRYQERFIILDGPPMTDIADTRILAELCDYVLVVARYGRTTNAQIKMSLNAIGSRKLLGVVLNDEPRVPWTR